MKSVLMRCVTQSLLVQSSVRSYLEPLIRLFRPHYRAGAIAAKVIKLKKLSGYVWLTLKPNASFAGFVPGQHVDLSVEIDGRRVQRTFSICSSLQEFQQSGTIEIAIRLVPGGQLSQWLDHSSVLGAWLQISAAAGEFTLQQQRPLCLIAAGSGITPIRAMLLSISRMTHPITLIYSYRDEAMFVSDLQMLAKKFPLFHLITHNSAEQGRLTLTDIQQQLSEPGNTDFYLCGPSEFSKAMKPALQQLGHQVFAESYGGVVSTGASQQVVFHQHAKSQVVAGSGSLLMLAERAGLTPRYGCRRGICQQCQCQKLHGQVKNLLTGELSTVGQEPIQLCISEAVTSVDIRL
jgi:ferredoxin-NADP reductase